MISFQETLLRKSVPVVLNVFNQHTYTKQIVDHLLSNGFGSIIIIDQASKYRPHLEYLKQIHRNSGVSVVALPENFGPHWFFECRLQNFLPNPFFYTDPDLSMPEILDAEFCTKLYEATVKYKVAKAGCALDISSPELFSDIRYFAHGREWTISEWEIRFWENKAEEGVYFADVDTTFHLFNKDYYDESKFYNGVRLSGDGFRVKHLPWYQNTIVPAEEEKFYVESKKHGIWINSGVDANS